MLLRIVLFALLATLLCPTRPACADTASDIAALKAAVASLQQTVASQQAQINALKSVTSGFSRVTDTTRTDGKKGTELFLTGFNLHVVNGLGATNGNPGTGTDTTTHVNGLGNVIIGYNALRTASGDTNIRTGSHNLVLGDQQNYSSYGGLMDGIYNTSSSGFAVAFGYRNTASGFASAVLSGNNNLASGSIAAVTGGHNNTASGLYSSIAGGKYNTASGEEAAVSGGYACTASGAGAVIGGGVLNTAEGDYCSVVGGEFVLNDAPYGFAAGGQYSSASPGPGVFHSP